MAAPRPLTRRSMLAALLTPALAGCTPPFAALTDPGSSAAARALLDASAAAHGGEALAAAGDVAVSYAGHFRPVVGLVQPDLVDAGFRGTSQERLLPALGLVTQAHEGPDGTKYVVRQAAADGEGSVRVWFNGVETHDRTKLQAAALVADGYVLFLLGPMLLARRAAMGWQLAGMERLYIDGAAYDCDVLRGRLTPGLGLSAADEVALFIDRADRLMRRVRFSLEGLDSTRGAVAQVDTWRHVELGGVRWPTRFHEHLLRPAYFPVHDWQLTGLDISRGLTPADIGGPLFTGPAIRPAAAR